MRVVKILVVGMIIGAGTSVAAAQDLEGILSGEAGKGESQQTLNRSYLAETVHGLIGTLKPEQNFFIREIEKADWKEALLSWNAAFGGTAFERTPDAKALRALLVFRSGLELTGIEDLFTINEPKKIHFQILSQWKETAVKSHPVWSYARLNWKPEWSEFFGTEIEMRVKAADLTANKDIQTLNKLVVRAPVDSKERALIDWNLALAYADKDQADKAAKIIGSLLKAKNNPVSEDLMNITAARMLYQNGYFEAARKYYDKVPKNSEDYLEAQEEKAWTFLRRGEPQNALAVTQSLVNPVFSSQVGPETWFLRALSQLKVCDYPGSIETLQGFPKEFKSRTVALEAIAKNGTSPELVAILNRMKTEKLNRIQVAKESKTLPRNLSRDKKLEFLLGGQRLLEKEAESAEALFAKSLQLADPQGQFDSIRKKYLERAQNQKSSVIARAVELARQEVEETKKILNKMLIVETEVIQRIDSAHRIGKAPDVKMGTTGSASEDSIKFPFEKEFWFDELSNYKVDIKKGCQARRTE